MEKEYKDFDFIISNKDKIKYYKTEEWKEKADKCKKLHNNKCYRCGDTELLQAHHLTYENFGNEKQEDLMCLCVNCHRFVHGLDTKTGEVKTYKEIKVFTRKAAKGWRMMYQSYLEEIMCSLKGVKQRQILFWIFKKFTKSRQEIIFNQTSMAKEFETNQQYISKTIKLLENKKVLFPINKIRNSKIYRLNPYLYIPMGANAVELQDEWDLITHAPSKIKDKFEYLEYLQSEAWKEKANKCKSRDGSCVRCGSNKDLEAHHLTYDNLYMEKDEDLITLCSECHKQEHEV